MFERAEVRSFSSKQYGLIARCLDTTFAAEEWRKSEKVAVKACETPPLAGRIETLLSEAVAKLDKACERDTTGAFGLFAGTGDASAASTLHERLRRRTVRSPSTRSSGPFISP